MSSSTPSFAEAEVAPARVRKWPAGIPFIVGNEAAERFSFYGMRAILFIYTSWLFTELTPGIAKTAADARATQIVHLFIAGVYAFPMIGALLADRLFGKYRVIMWLSIVYTAGHAVLAVAAHLEYGLYAGLALIAIGAGGIKPCVSANVGDQFTKENGHLIPRVYQIFYFSINFGSFFSTLLTPYLYRHYGAEVAFGIPGVLMAIATFVFWLGRDRFVKVEPSPGGNRGVLDALSAISLFLPFAIFAFGPHGHYAAKTAASVVFVIVWWVLFQARQRIEPDRGFISVVVHSITHQKERKPGQSFFDVARAKYGDEAADGASAVSRIIVVFSAVCFFWALFDQHSSTFVNQARSMDLFVTLPWGTSMELQPAQLAALNPAFVMIIIPLLNFVVYPPLEKLGVKITPLRKMTAGMFLTASSFAAVALLQGRIDALATVGDKVPVLWQIVPYMLLTTGEVLVSVTGLEFAYTQAPRSMKSTIMGFFLLTVTVGNMMVVFLAGFEDLPLVKFFWIFAGLMVAASLVFSVLAYFYKERTYLQDVPVSH